MHAATRSIPVGVGSSGADVGESPSKASYVLHRIRTDILSAVFKPGQKLAFNLLTSKYQVGLSPIREALSQLVGSGLVVLESQRGFRVAPVSYEDLADVAATRCHLEIFALGLSIERGDERWRGRVQQAVDRFVHIAAKVGDQRPINEDWQEIHRNVHFALISACGSPILLQFCNQIYDRFDRYRRLAIPTQSFMAGTAGDHQKLVDLALAGKRDEAKALLQRHMQDIADVVIANFSAAASGGTAPPSAKNRKRSR